MNRLKENEAFLYALVTLVLVAVIGYIAAGKYADMHERLVKAEQRITSLERALTSEVE